MTIEDENKKRSLDNNAADTVLPFARLEKYGEHKRAVSAVAVAPNATSEFPLVASASADGTVKVWDLCKETPEAPPPPPAPSPTSIPANLHQQQQQNNNNAHLGTALIPSLTLVGHSRGINDVTWSKTGQYVATASDDKTLRLWDANTGDALVEFRGHLNFVFCCQFNSGFSNNLLVSGGFDETVKLWDVRTGDCVSTLPAHSDPVTGVDFNRDGSCVVSGSHDGLLRIWDTATGECLKTIYAHGNPPVSHVKYSPNSKYVLAGTLDSKCRLWHMASKESDATTTTTSNTCTSSNSIGSVAVTKSGGKCTRLYSCPQHVNAKYCIASDFCVSNPNRRCIVTGSERGCVVLYDIQSQKVHQVLEGGHCDAVLAVASHPTQEFIASGGMTQDKTVQFWKPKEQQIDDNNKKARA